MANNITNAQALAVMVDVAVNGTAVEDALAKVGVDKAAFDGKATHMLAQALKPKSGNKAPSRASRENAALLDKVVDLINATGERVTSVVIRDEYGLRSTQRAVAVARMGLENGKLVKVIIKSRVYYSTPGLETVLASEDNDTSAA